MSEHTEWELQLAGQTIYALNDRGFNHFSAHVQDAHTPPKDLEAIARRLFACWNACELMPTEDIERYAAVGAGFMRVVVRADDYRRQRDQLLEALHTIQHSISQAKVFGNDWRRELVLIEEVANTAIAAVNRGES